MASLKTFRIMRKTNNFNGAEVPTTDINGFVDHRTWTLPKGSAMGYSVGNPRAEDRNR